MNVNASPETFLNEYSSGVDNTYLQGVKVEQFKTTHAHWLCIIHKFELETGTITLQQNNMFRNTVNQNTQIIFDETCKL